MMKKDTLKQKLGIGNERGETFVGFRPTTFKDIKKYNRKAKKAELIKEIKEVG